MFSGGQKRQFAGFLSPVQWSDWPRPPVERCLSADFGLSFPALWKVLVMVSGSCLGAGLLVLLSWRCFSKRKGEGCSSGKRVSSKSTALVYLLYFFSVLAAVKKSGEGQEVYYDSINEASPAAHPSEFTVILQQFSFGSPWAFPFCNF